MYSCVFRITTNFILLYTFLYAQYTYKYEKRKHQSIFLQILRDLTKQKTKEVYMKYIICASLYVFSKTSQTKYPFALRLR